MKKLFLICTFCLVGVSTSYLSAKSSLERGETVEDKINVDCVSYALGVLDALEWVSGTSLSPSEYNEAFNSAEKRCNDREFYHD